jgi:hypothetical protein
LILLAKVALIMPFALAQVGHVTILILSGQCCVGVGSMQSEDVF